MMPLRLAPLWWSAGALFVAIDVVMSLLPQTSVDALLPDKLVHFMTYLFLGFWFMSLAWRWRGTALAGVIALGAVLELLQGLTPSRQSEWLDLLANTSGAVLALLLVMVLPANVFIFVERRILGRSHEV